MRLHSEVRPETESKAFKDDLQLLYNEHSITFEPVTISYWQGYLNEVRPETESRAFKDDLQLFCKFSSRTGMKQTPLFFVIVLSICSLVSSRVSIVPNRGCVSKFYEAPRQFDFCTNKLCFVILPEQPYVFSEPTLLKSTGGIPCNDTNFKGLFFDVLKEVSESVPEVREAMCIYGGNDCTFDNNVRFVEDAVKQNASYRFIAGGYFLFLPHRRTDETIQSHPWDFDVLVVVMRPDDASRSFASALEQVIQPFSIRGWGLLLGFLLIFLIGFVAHCLRFCPVRTFRGFVKWVILARQRDRGVWETASWNSLKVSWIVFCAILILLYEISVVGFILTGKYEFVDKIEEFQSFRVRDFAVIEGDASETIFKAAIDWKADKKPEWKQPKALKDLTDLIVTRQVKYGIQFDTVVANVLQSENLCDSLVAVTTEKREFGGWFYGSGVPIESRTRIDTALSALALAKKPQTWVDRYGEAPLNCGKVAGRIYYKVLLVLLLLTAAPFLVKHIVALILSCYCTDIEYDDDMDTASITRLDSRDLDSIVGISFITKYSPSEQNRTSNKWTQYDG